MKKNPIFSDDELQTINIKPDELEAITQKLGRWTAPEVQPEQTTALVKMLSGELQTSGITPKKMGASDMWWLLILRAQIRVVQTEIWAASSVVMLLGLLVTLASYTSIQNPSALPFVLIAPLTTAFAISFLYGPTEEPAIEIELSTPVSQRLILLARLTLVFGFNLVLGFIISLLLSLSGLTTPLWMLIALWLAPMTFLSALAFVTGATSGNSGVSVLLIILLWTTQVVRQQLMVSPRGSDLVSFIPDLLAVETLPLLVVLGVLLVVIGLWVVGREERWLRSLNV